MVYIDPFTLLFHSLVLVFDAYHPKMHSNIPLRDRKIAIRIPPRRYPQPSCNFSFRNYEYYNKLSKSDEKSYNYHLCDKNIDLNDSMVMQLSFYS